MSDTEHKKYKQIISAIEDTECFVRCKNIPPTMGSPNDVFFIKGTRFAVAFYAHYSWGNNWGIDPSNKETKVRWYKKRKNKKYFDRISLLHILDDESKAIKPSRRSEILFHLDILSKELK